MNYKGKLGTFLNSSKKKSLAAKSIYKMSYFITQAKTEQTIHFEQTLSILHYMQSGGTCYCSCQPSTRYGSIEFTAISQTSNFGLIRRERSAFKNWLWGDRTLHRKVCWQMLPILSQAFIKASSLKLWKFPYGVPGGPSCSRISVFDCSTAAMSNETKFPLKSPTVDMLKESGSVLCGIIHVTLTWFSEHFRCDGFIRILTTSWSLCFGEFGFLSNGTCLQ